MSGLTHNHLQLLKYLASGEDNSDLRAEEREAIKGALEEIEELKEAVGRDYKLYGVGAVITKCIECKRPYPDYSISSRITCWECRIKEKMNE